MSAWRVSLVGLLEGESTVEAWQRLKALPAGTELELEFETVEAENEYVAMRDAEERRPGYMPVEVRRA